MPRNPQPVLPITPATVEILGHVYSGTDTIWAGLRLHKAEYRGPDCLSVPWCHIDDRWTYGGCVYRLYPRRAGYGFAKARNGAWVLKLDGGSRL